MARKVFCAKLQRELPGLDRPPYPGALGKRIYDNISATAWAMWEPHSVVLINHYGLVLADPDARQFMREQMEAFFFSEEGRMPEGWTPEGQEGGGSKGSSARSKGAPAAARK